MAVSPSPPGAPTQDRLVARALVKRFGGLVAVDHVDLSIGGEGITALIGPNGAGKTTLFNLIAGQLQPDEGTVSVDGEDLTGKAAHVMSRHGVGRGFQEVRLWASMSVLDNVMVYAQPRATASVLRTGARPIRQVRLARRARAEALETLDYLGIARLRDELCGSLGFADQKLVAVARLIALRPRVLLLDEPASGLDHAGRLVLARTIEKLAADGLSVCFVEHNTHLVRDLASRVLFLAQGKILAEGSPEEVFSHAGLAEAYLGIA